ncbi:MAG: mycofactocin biosynthesis chaperone MftB [Actinobacteria bacterium]|nr:mycofactocin biosynthesis chaperone MftB [Actinomycetota bacterium]
MTVHTATMGALRLHPNVALRPEPFGALAYHYDTRRLVFLRHPQLVDVVHALHEHTDLDTTMDALDIAETLRGPFQRAIANLAEAGIVITRDDEKDSS